MELGDAKGPKVIEVVAKSCQLLSVYRALEKNGAAKNKELLKLFATIWELSPFFMYELHSSPRRESSTLAEGGPGRVESVAQERSGRAQASFPP